MEETDWEESGQLNQIQNPALTGAVRYKLHVNAVSISVYEFSLSFVSTESLFVRTLLHNYSMVAAWSDTL